MATPLVHTAVNQVKRSRSRKVRLLIPAGSERRPPLRRIRAYFPQSLIYILPWALILFDI